jgi:hypothetical protein
MLVVVALELSKNSSQVRLSDDEQVVQAFTAHGADEPLGVGVRRGAWTGVLITRRPAEVNTVSNPVVNFASRSRIKNM